MSYESRGYRSRHDGGGGDRGGGGGERGGGGGGGGRYRGGGYRNRDERRSHYQRRPYDRPEQKEDELEDIEFRLKSLIIKIGDKITPDLRTNLAKMKNILDNDYAKYPETVQDTLKACISELPAKAPVYGTLIGLLNISSHTVVEKLMVEFNASLTDAFATSNWFKLKQLLRFYGELVNSNVVLPAVFCNLLNDVLAPLDQPNQLRQRLDCIVYIVLATLPWYGRELSERNSSELDLILKKIEIYMQRRGTVPELNILTQFTDKKTDDRLAHIWNVIQELQSKSWDLPLIPKPYRWFDSEFASALQHDLPQFNVPNHDDNVKYIGPVKTMKILVDDQGKTVSGIPDHNSIDYFILQETISDVMKLFEANRKDCAKYLLGIPNSFEPNYFKPPSEDDNGSDRMDDDKSMDTEESGWSLSDLLVEAAFSQMLYLPLPPVRQVFYSCVFIELCRAESSSFPMAMGRGVKSLFNKLPTMDVECIHRLWCWFSHHLSNFGFQWDWKSWDQVLTMDPISPQACFVRETLEKEVRLSYYERIKTTVPDEFHALISPVAPGPDFEYKDATNPLHATAKSITESLRTKKSVEEVRDALAKFKDEQAAQGADEQKQQNIVREMFIQCLLLVGSKSFSHILNVVERYLDVLRFLNTTPEGRLHTVQIVASFWKNNTQFMGILLDKLLNYRVIDPTSVISWIFEPEQLGLVGRSFIWEILQNTLNKVVSRVAQVKAKLNNFQSLHETNKAKRAESEMNELAQAEAQQELDTIRIVENSLTTVSREQKEVFMIVYQKFAHVLQDLIKTKGTTPESDWTCWWIFGWFKEMLRVYSKECGDFMTTLETLVFTSDMDDRIIEVFSQVKALKQEEKVLV